MTLFSDDDQAARNAAIRERDSPSDLTRDQMADTALLISTIRNGVREDARRSFRAGKEVSRVEALIPTYGLIPRDRQGADKKYVEEVLRGLEIQTIIADALEIPRERVTIYPNDTSVIIHQPRSAQISGEGMNGLVVDISVRASINPPLK